MNANKTEINNILLRAEVLGKKNWLHAVNILEKASDDYPRERSIYLTLGDIYSRHKKFEQAIDSYQKALTIDAGDEQLLFVIGNCYLSLSDYKMALYYYEQVSDDSPELHYNKALAYAYLGDHDLSLHYLKLLIKQISGNLNIYYFLVEEYLRMHKYKEALQWLDEIEKHFGVQSYQQILKGFVWSFQKIWLKSFMAFKKADELKPLSNADHLQTYSQSSWQIGQLDKAIELLQRALAISPYLNLLHEDLIRVFIQKGDYASARDALQDAMRLTDNANPILIMLREKITKLEAEQHKKMFEPEPDDK
ncbi:MAG: tetratricopeptide repeat protein [Candidatus Cloacimonadaceae bacterium]